MKKTIKDLNLCDDFLFYHVMQKPELVIQLLEIALDLPGKIEKIEYVEREKTLRGKYDGKGVRLDVYVRTDMLTVYNIEIQQKKRRALGKRGRQYQSTIDMDILKSGEDYDKLKPQYIIFICTFDPFDRGFFRYRFSNRCHEDAALELGDETMKVFLNTKGCLDNASLEMREFLLFLENSTPDEAKRAQTPFIHALSEQIEKVKADEEIGGSFMTFEQYLKDIQWEYEDKMAEMEAKYENEKLETARKLKKQGITIKIISEATGLDMETVEKL